MVIKMNELFSKNYQLRTSDFNCYDNLMPHAILDFFQDVAGIHADILDIGYEKMISRNLIWVLVRTKYEVIKNPHSYETVKVTTWPKKKGKIDFDREYTIEDLNGNLLVKGVSKWIVVNVNTRRISLAKDINYNTEPCSLENFPGSFPKIDDFSIEDCNCYETMTTFSDLDHNMHINNINYAKYILNAIKLKKDELVKTFEINYVKELQKDEKVLIYSKKDGKTILIKGIINTNEISFVAKIELF